MSLTAKPCFSSFKLENHSDAELAKIQKLIEDNRSSTSGSYCFATDAKFNLLVSIGDEERQERATPVDHDFMLLAAKFADSAKIQHASGLGIPHSDDCSKVG